MATSAPDGVLLRLPFDGTWLTQNSPARRVPSHGTHLFAITYAIGFVAPAAATVAHRSPAVHRA